MNKQLQERLSSLKNEYASGEQQLANLERQASELRQKMLRIGGAIQVLEEVLATAEDGASEHPK